VYSLQVLPYARCKQFTGLLSCSTFDAGLLLLFRVCGDYCIALVLMAMDCYCRLLVACSIVSMDKISYNCSGSITRLQKSCSNAPDFQSEIVRLARRPVGFERDVIFFQTCIRNDPDFGTASNQ
jgi:hypothetical protein